MHSVWTVSLAGSNPGQLNQFRRPFDRKLSADLLAPCKAERDALIHTYIYVRARIRSELFELPRERASTRMHSRERARFYMDMYVYVYVRNYVNQLKPPLSVDLGSISRLLATLREIHVLTKITVTKAEDP